MDRVWAIIRYDDEYGPSILKVWGNARSALEHCDRLNELREPYEAFTIEEVDFSA